jgi:hypothetical protein
VGGVKRSQGIRNYMFRFICHVGNSRFHVPRQGTNLVPDKVLNQFLTRYYISSLKIRLSQSWTESWRRKEISMEEKRVLKSLTQNQVSLD